MPLALTVISHSPLTTGALRAPANASQGNSLGCPYGVSVIGYGFLERVVVQPVLCGVFGGMLVIKFIQRPIQIFKLRQP